MDSTLSLKYVNALIKTVSGLDDATFNARVNATKHEYADWIATHIPDETLVKNVRAEMTKSGLVALLSTYARAIPIPKTITSNPAQPAISRTTPVTSTPIAPVLSTLPSGTTVNLSSNTSSPSVVPVSSTIPPRSTTPPLSPARSLPFSSSSPVISGMTASQKEKYVNALVKTISGLDDVTFNARVNATKHEYADWVMKTMHDEQLASQLRSLHTKPAVLELLRKQIVPAMQELAASTPTIPSMTSSSSITPALVSSPPAAPSLQAASVITPVSTLASASVTTPLHAPSSALMSSPEISAPKIVHTPASPPLKSPASVPSYEMSDLHEQNAAVQSTTIVASAITSQPSTHTVTPTITALPAASQVSSMKFALPSTTRPVSAKLSSKELFNRLKETRAAKARPQLMRDRPKGMIDFIVMSPKEVIQKLNLITSQDRYLATEEDFSVEKKQLVRLKTGIPGFDEMIDKGIPKGSTILASGGPGSGKTTFCIQMLGWAAQQGEKCLFISLEETPERLIEHMESYGFDPKSSIANGTLVIQNRDPFTLSRSIEALLAHSRGELLIDITTLIDIIPPGFNPDRIVIDSLSAIASAFNESNTAYRIYVNLLMNMLAKNGATSFLITEVQGIEHIGHGLVEEFLADGVVVFYNLQRGNIKQSALEVLKMRAVNHDKKIVPFEFVEGVGIKVYPLERVFI